MGRNTEEFSTGRQRVSMFDVCDVTCPATIGDQLRQDGYTNANIPQGSQGRVRVRPRYPLAGNAGFDTDNDADDYNTAALQTAAQDVSSSSGPP
jgi:hypothetical protein